MSQLDLILNIFFETLSENPIPIKCTTIPTINAVILSPNTYHVKKNATNDGTVIIAPIIEPLKNIPFVGRGFEVFLSTNNYFISIIKISVRFKFFI